MISVFTWVGFSCLLALMFFGTVALVLYAIDYIFTKTKVLKLITTRMWYFYETLPGRKTVDRFPIILVAWDTRKHEFINHLGIDEYGRDEQEQKDFYRQQLTRKMKDEGLLI